MRPLWRRRLARGTCTIQAACPSERTPDDSRESEKSSASQICQRPAMQITTWHHSETPTLEEHTQQRDVDDWYIATETIKVNVGSTNVIKTILQVYVFFSINYAVWSAQSRDRWKSFSTTVTCTLHFVKSLFSLYVCLSVVCTSITRLSCE